MDGEGEVCLKCNERAMYTHTQARVLAHTYYDKSVGVSAASLVRTELSTTGGKLLGSEQRKVCEKEGVGGVMEGGEEVWSADKDARGRAE